MDWISIGVDAYPYPFNHKGIYHYRSGNTKQELKGAALNRFLLRKQGLHWDGVSLIHPAFPQKAPASLGRRPRAKCQGRRVGGERIRVF